MKYKLIIGILLMVFLVGCEEEPSTVKHSGIVEGITQPSLLCIGIAINGKYFECICIDSMKDVSIGDDVNVYERDTIVGCNYIISKKQQKEIRIE